MYKTKQYLPVFKTALKFSFSYAIIFFFFFFELKINEMKFD
jgi:hypothetical protein